MTFKELALQEKSALDVTHQGVITANDLTQATAAAAQSFNMAALPVGSIITAVWLRLITPFQNPADAAFNATTVDVGDTGSATRFATAQQVNANGTPITVPQFSPTQGGPYAASQFLTVNFNSMAAKSLSNLKVGELHVLVKLIDAKKLSDQQTPTPLTK
jgi:hypothetical protein